MSSEKQDKTYRLIIAEWLTLAGIFLGAFWILHADMLAIDARIEQRIIIQEKRTDKNLELYCEMQKEIKDLYIQMSRRQKA